MTCVPSRRELDVLELMAEGMSNEEIAAVLGIAPFTVKAHARRIAQKLGVVGRSSARSASVSHAFRSGWIR